MEAHSKVYLDISVAGAPVGRIVCKLFVEQAPKAAENFYHLCCGDRSVPKFGLLSYKNNQFHRVIKNFMVQCGDVVYGSGSFVKSEDIGKGGCSIHVTEEELLAPSNELPCYGNFADENMGEFTKPFYVAMANTGAADSNSSQFFITTYPAPHLNHKHSIFGEVIRGKSVVRTIENVDVDSDGFPQVCVRIDDCGEWDESMGVPLYNASNNEIGGDIFEEYPDDDTHFDSEDFDAAFKAATVIKESGTLLFKQRDYQNAYYKYLKALKYVNEYIPELDVDAKNHKLFKELKQKLYLNLSLALHNLRKYDESITYATYLLEMDDTTEKDRAKAFYRRANAYYCKNRLDEALNDYKNCHKYNPEDKAVLEKIGAVEKQLQSNKEKIAKNLAKFFANPA